MIFSIETRTYLSEDILLFIIKKLEKDKDYLINPVYRIYSFLALKNLYNSNNTHKNLFNKINMSLVLSGCHLFNVELSNKDLRGIRFSHAYMSRTILKNCNFTNVNLEYVDLQEADLSGANLIGANLTGANLSSANLSGANLSGANLDKTNFSNTKIDNIILDNINLKKIQINSSL